MDTSKLNSYVSTHQNKNSFLTVLLFIDRKIRIL